MKFSGKVIMLLSTCATATPLFAADKPAESATIKDWVKGKIEVVAEKCVGSENFRKLSKKADLVPSTLYTWPTFVTHVNASKDKVIPGTAGKYMSRVFDQSSGTLVTLQGTLSGLSYPPMAMADGGAKVSHVQNCMAMLAGKGNLKLAAPILQAALDASYSSTNTQALVLEGGTITSAYAWALDDTSEAPFPGITRSEVMLDLWAWLRANNTYAANTNLKIIGFMSAIEAHLVSDIRMESLLSGSANGGGGFGFLSGSAEGNGSAKMLSHSSFEGFDTAVFTEENIHMPTAAELATRLQSTLQFAADPENSKSFAGENVPLSGRITPAPRSICQPGIWVADTNAIELNAVSWESATRSCKFSVTAKPGAASTETIRVPLWLTSVINTTNNPKIRVGLDVDLSNEAEMISFISAEVAPPKLPAVGSVDPMTVTIAYRVKQTLGRDLSDVSTDAVTFKCGADTAIQVNTQRAYVAGTGNKDLVLIFDAPASSLARIAQTPVSCTVTGSITAKIKGPGGTVSKVKALPTASFDSVRPAAAPAAPPV